MSHPSHWQGIPYKRLCRRGPWTRTGLGCSRRCRQWRRSGRQGKSVSVGGGWTCSPRCDIAATMPAPTEPRIPPPGPRPIQLPTLRSSPGPSQHGWTLERRAGRSVGDRTCHRTRTFNRQRDFELVLPFPRPAPALDPRTQHLAASWVLDHDPTGKQRSAKFGERCCDTGARGRAAEGRNLDHRMLNVSCQLLRVPANALVNEGDRHLRSTGKRPREGE